MIIFNITLFNLKRGKDMCKKEGLNNAPLATFGMIGFLLIVLGAWPLIPALYHTMQGTPIPTWIGMAGIVLSFTSVVTGTIILLSSLSLNKSK